MNGFKIILTYYIVYIIVPLLSLFFFRDLYTPVYYIADISFEAIIFIFLALLIIFLIASNKDVVENNDSLTLGNIFSIPFRKYIKFEKVISLTLLIFAIGYFFLGTNSYRYGGTAISDQGGLFYVLIVRSIAFIYLLNFFRRFVLHREKINISSFLCGNAHSIFLISTNGGTADLLIASFFLMITLLPQLLSVLLTNKKTDYEFGYRNIAKLSFFAFSPILFVFTLLIGESSKADTGYLLSFDELLLELELETLGFFIIFLVDFLSTHLYSLLNYIEHGVQYHSNILIINEIYNNFLFRLNIILGEPFSMIKPEIASVNRLNYMELSLSPLSIHEGTSPGYLASFVIAFGKYLGFTFVILYSFFLVKTLATVLHSEFYKINLAGAFIICQSLLWLFASPIDFLVIFDNSTVLLIFYLSFYFYCKELNISNE